MIATQPVEALSWCRLVLPEPIKEGKGKAFGDDFPHSNACNTPHAAARRVNVMAMSCAPELF